MPINTKSSLEADDSNATAFMEAATTTILKRIGQRMKMPEPNKKGDQGRILRSQPSTVREHHTTCHEPKFVNGIPV